MILAQMNIAWGKHSLSVNKRIEMEPHCQSVLTPPPPFCQAVTQLSLDVLEPLSQFVWEGGRECACSCVCVCVHVLLPASACVCVGMSKRRPRDLVIRCLCFFPIFVCRIKAALVTQRCPGLSTDCSPTYSSHLMWINGLNCGPSLQRCLAAQSLNPLYG